MQKQPGVPAHKGEDESLQRPGPPGRHGFGPRRGEDVPLGEFNPKGKFGRMFPELLPLIPPLEALDALGQAMTDPDPASADGDNPGIPAGYTYLGQFIDHDITFDPTALQEILVDPQALQNFRTPMMDLDCVYGAGQTAQPYLYQREDRDSLLIGKTSSTPPQGDPDVPTELPNDLPRASHGFALIGDPRNDENLIVAQLHLAFLKFHNKIVRLIKSGEIPRESPLRKSEFDEARDLTLWHYQWIVLHDFLRRTLDQEELDKVLNLYRTCGPRLLRFTNGPFIPVEFSAAAYRLGHSMVREVYDFNRVFREGGVTPATLRLLFFFSGLSGPGNTVPIPSDWVIDWRRFFDLGIDEVAVNPSRKLDPFLVPQLQNLPGVPPPSSLAIRNLRRGRSLGLPPGQSVARFMGYEALTPEEIATGPDGAVAREHDFHIETPLWYYILKEAQVQAGGLHLGQVGSRIVAEVFVALLAADSSSFLARKPEWKPTLPREDQNTFTMADLLRFVDDLNPIG